MAEILATSPAPVQVENLSTNEEIIDGAFLVSAGVKQCGRKRTFCDASFENGYRISKAKLTNNSGFISKSCGDCSIFEITFTDGTSQTFTTTADTLKGYLSSVLDLSTIKTCNFKQIKSTVTDISYLFSSMGEDYSFCMNMIEFICDACLEKVTDMENTWGNCSSLTSFPAIDTSNVTNINYTWGDCSSLTSFPAIDTSNVTNMYYTWSYCSSLTSFGGVSDCSNANSTTWRNTPLNPKPCGQ